MDKVYFITLGCDKNRVDGEVMLGLLSDAGLVITTEPSEADAIVVNTCGFIKDAVQESIDTVLELAEHKNTGNCRVLVVAGCMAERYKNQISEEIPEADAVMGIADYIHCAKVVCELLKKSYQPVGMDEKTLTQCRLTGWHVYGTPHVAYVKIAEGCDNRCTYCTIPSIRGTYISRPFENVLDECTQLVESGARELILVAQDTALYPRLHELISAITKLEKLTWVRLMYAYPEHITPDLIKVLSLPKVAPYLDMPIQHANDEVLKRMGRKSTQTELKNLIRVLRKQVPGIALRTTILTGFPGETEEAFEDLCRFVQEMQFERLGVFGYSREEGTPAARMKEQLPPDEIQARRDRLMLLQQAIHNEKQQALIGKVIDVMVDAIDESGMGIGRSMWDAPDVDSVITFTGFNNITYGQLVPVKLTGADEYDLQGEVNEPAE